MSTNAELPMWSGDVPISVPQPPAHAVEVPMFGFGMTRYGLAHDLSDADYELLRTPSYAPERAAHETVYDDAEVDR